MDQSYECVRQALTQVPDDAGPWLCVERAGVPLDFAALEQMTVKDLMGTAVRITLLDSEVLFNLSRTQKFGDTQFAWQGASSYCNQSDPALKGLDDCYALVRAWAAGS